MYKRRRLRWFRFKLLYPTALVNYLLFWGGIFQIGTMAAVVVGSVKIWFDSAKLVIGYVMNPEEVNAFVEATPGLKEAVADGAMGKIALALLVLLIAMPFLAMGQLVVSIVVSYWMVWFVLSTFLLYLIVWFLFEYLPYKKQERRYMNEILAINAQRRDKDLSRQTQRRQRNAMEEANVDTEETEPEGPVQDKPKTRYSYDDL